MKRREYFLYAKKTKITTLFNNSSQRSAILENIHWTKTAYAEVSSTTRIRCFHSNQSINKRRRCILAVRLKQNSVRYLCPVDILQNGAKVTQMRQIVE